MFGLLSEENLTVVPDNLQLTIVSSNDLQAYLIVRSQKQTRFYSNLEFYIKCKITKTIATAPQLKLKQT